MNRASIAAALALTLGACAVTVPPAPQAGGVDAVRLAELYRRQDCFALRDALAGAPDGAVEDFYRAAVAVAFNRPDEVIGEVRRFLASPEAAATRRGGGRRTSCWATPTCAPSATVRRRRCTLSVCAREMSSRADRGHQAGARENGKLAAGPFQERKRTPVGASHPIPQRSPCRFPEPCRPPQPMCWAWTSTLTGRA